ncbi:MAG TPA: cytochrome c peroxidase [Roseiarcus sp.]|nr:cytochrome c peroxidase [Roseiarcus sp.]
MKNSRWRAGGAAIFAAAAGSFVCAAASADEQRLEELGARLFGDANLSEPPGVSCASCHDPKTAFFGVNGSPVPAVARGATGALGARKPPYAMYASFTPPFGFVTKLNEISHKREKVPAGGQFRDGRASTLEEQAAGPLLNPAEMNNASKAAVVAKVLGAAYGDLARAALADKVDDSEAAFALITQAVAAYERTDAFHPFSSKFDDVMRGKAQFTPLEAEGFGLFKNSRKGNCLACHAGGGPNPSSEPGGSISHDPKDWLFTDFTYDTLGAPRNAAIPANANPENYDLGLCRREGLAAMAPKGFNVETVCGAFKTPTLRNVALAAPYFHNGSVATLREAVAFYATRDVNPERWYPKGEGAEVKKFDDLPEKYRPNVNIIEVPYDRQPGQKPRLNDHEIDAITAFLQTLTDTPAP